ncbi:stealth family protein [Diaminobutyricimonas sp. TR449]|uniref:stealth family protein n=1 Tax=Diaminobutyricimonas sp. TR449 TaxID=2708076 RepID=UPI001421B08C|nr:stealth family protein [Diaminobutyricimonas sp. TR449]
MSELVVVSSGTWPGRLDRDDIVVRKGMYTLINGHLTPHESMVEDLLAVRDVLDQAGISFLLVRSDNDRPAIAVDKRERKDVERAFAEAFANEPFYAKPLDGRSDQPVLLAEGALAGGKKASLFRLYRPRIEPIGRLRYGASTAMQLELWSFGDDAIRAAQPNALTRRDLPRSEAVTDEVQLYGRTWPTLRGMFAPHASDVTFDIDLVFSWVDGSSEEFQRARAKRMASYVVGDGDDSEARFRQIDELKYALRSVNMYAPWIRRIFIATDSPTPSWLDEHPRVTVVRSEEFFQNPDALPTHNSHAVESQLHHIPGLAEHFLYSNDDMFFGRPVRPEMFFSPGGITKFIEATTRIGLGDNNPERSGFENAARVNRRLLHERFGRITTRHLEHAATPLRRSVLLEMEREFAEDFARTAASPFRSATDISVTNSFYHYYALMTGKAVVQENAKVLYVETTLKNSIGQLKRLLKDRSFDFFCLNDGSKPELDAEERTERVRTFLNQYFPFAAPWEKDADGVSGARESASSSAGQSPAAQMRADQLPPDQLPAGQVSAS